VFHLAALGALGGLAVGWPGRWLVVRLRGHPVGRRLLRDGPLVAAVLVPAALLAYAAERHLHLDALDPRLLAIPVLFVAGARGLHLLLRRLGDGRLGRRALVAAWMALATALVLSGHSLARRPGLVTAALQRSEVGRAVLGAVRTTPWLDADRDGYPRALCAQDCDCDDWDPRRHPAAPDLPNDGVDQDCSGADAAPPPPPPRQPVRPPPRPRSRPKPDLMIVTVDTLRADHLGSYGYARATSPRMDELAAAGTRFSQARAQGSMTVWSMASFVSGRYFTELERTSGKWPRILDSGRLLGERLSEAGYHTVGLAPQFWFYRRYGLPRGFARWDTRVVRLRTPFRHHPTGDLLTDRALRLLRSLPEGRPVLLWVHYGDPHSDYVHHPRFSRFGRDRKGMYDGEIRFTDHHIGRLLDGWRALRRNRPFVGRLTADHGENLVRAEDHGRLYHGTDLYDSLIRVPLIVWGDGVEATVVDTPVALVDVLPTLLELAGLPPDPSLRGLSLGPWLRGEDPPHPPVFSEKPLPESRAEKCMVAWPHKLVWHEALNVYSLFDLAADPGEQTDLFGQEPARDRALVDRFTRWRTLELASRPPGRGQELAAVSPPGPTSPRGAGPPTPGPRRGTRSP